MLYNTIRGCLIYLAVGVGVGGITAACSSPMNSPPVLSPKQDAWGSCIASAPELPAESAMVLVYLPRDTSRIADSGYAEQQMWFRNHASIELDGRDYAKFGRIHRFNPAGLRAKGLDLWQVGEYTGVPLYRISPDPCSGGVLFIPLRPGCLFYPYQWQTDRTMRYHG